MMAHETRMSEQASNVKFVNEVEKRPCLYNPDLMHYSRKDITDKAWEEVGEIMNMTGGACKEKWRNLRIVYMRHMKSNRISGTGRRKRRYYLSDAMQFLLPYIKVFPAVPQKNITTEEDETKEKTFYDAYRFNRDEKKPEHILPDSWSVPMVKIEPEEDHSNDTSTNHDSEGNSRKRSIQETDQYHVTTDAETERVDYSTTCFATDPNDPIRSFLNSLVPELNDMNGAQFKTFKRRVLALIDDITDEKGNHAANKV